MADGGSGDGGNGSLSVGGLCCRSFCTIEQAATNEHEHAAHWHKHVHPVPLSLRLIGPSSPNPCEPRGQSCRKRKHRPANDAASATPLYGDLRRFVGVLLHAPDSNRRRGSPWRPDLAGGYSGGMSYWWIFPLEVALILWAAFIVLGIKGLLFHRQPRTKPRARVEFVDPQTGEVIRPGGMGLGCSLCLLFLIWPLFIAAKIDEWLPPPQGPDEPPTTEST